MWWLGALAFAQEAAVESPGLESPVDPCAEAASACESERQALEQELAEMQERLSTQGAEGQALLGAVARALDPSVETAQALDALRLVAASGDPAVPSVLRAAAWSRSAALRAEALALAFGVSPELGLALSQEVVRSDRLAGPERTQGLAALEQAGQPAAGLALIALSRESELPRPLRAEAGDAALRAYPELVAAEDEGVGSSDPIGVGLLTGAGALTGGVMLSSIGVWGQSDAATAIGAIGGTAIGGASALTYGLTQPVTLGQGARVASNVSWGVTGAALTNNWLIDGFGETQDNQRALIRVVGVGAGAGLGVWRMQHNPTAADALEMNVAGLAGMGIGTSVYSLAIHKTVMDCYNAEVCDYDAMDELNRGHAGAALGGAALAIGAQTLMRDRFQPTLTDYALSAVITGQAAASTAMLHDSVAWSEDRGGERPRFGTGDLALLAASAGYGATWVLSDIFEPTPEQVALGTWTALLGDGLGAGVPLLLKADGAQVEQGAALLGAAGLAAGVGLHNQLDLSRGDVALQAVFVPIALAEGIALGNYLDYANADWDNDQAPGLMLTAASAVGIAGLASSPFIDPQADDMAFLGASAVWGAWYGTLLPVSFSPDGDARELLLTGSIGTDVGVAAGLGLIYGVGLEPRRTVLPQLMGVAGATMGSLGVALGTQDGQAIAAGAVIGSTVGLGVGSLIEVNRENKPQPVSLKLHRPRVDLPGHWSVAAMPTAMPDGALGGYVGVSAMGF